MNYKREELDYIAAQLIPVVLEKLGVEAQGVSEVEIVTDLTGVYSLPAYKKVDGTEKVVEAPVSLLQGVALDAVKSATDTANTAAANADRKREELEQNEATRQANEQTRQNQESARQTAEAARKTGETTRQSNETQRQTDAAAKLAELNTAKGNAEAATLAANRAATAANTEAQNLSTLKRETQNAASSAGAAAQTAGEKIVELDALMKAFSGESAAAPVILEVSAPATISTRNRVPQRIDARLLPGYVVQNLLYLKDEGDSLKVNPSGKLTVAGTGTTTFYVIPPGNTELWKEVSITVRSPLIRLSNGKMRLNGGKIRIV